MRIFFLLIFPNLPITFSEHWVFLASQDALEVMGVTHWVSHCTMGHAVEIKFWKFLKVNKYYMLIFDLKMFIPFVNGVKLPTFWGIFCVFFCVWKNWTGGLTRLRFWSLGISIICNKKVQNGVFVSILVHGEYGLKFLCFNWCDSGWWRYQANTNW